MMRVTCPNGLVVGIEEVPAGAVLVLTTREYPSEGCHNTHQYPTPELAGDVAAQLIDLNTRSAVRRMMVAWTDMTLDKLDRLVTERTLLQVADAVADNVFWLFIKQRDYARAERYLLDRISTENNFSAAFKLVQSLIFREETSNGT